MLSSGKVVGGHANYAAHRPEQSLVYQSIEKHYPARTGAIAQDPT
jgi:hypothetical protein